MERACVTPERMGRSEKADILKRATFLVSDILSDREARSATFGLEILCPPLLEAVKPVRVKT